MNKAKPSAQQRKHQHSASDALKLPKQFNPNRPISNGPWKTYAHRALNRYRALVKNPVISKADLIPRKEDLELISSLAYSRDDLADSLAELILKDSKVARQLEKGLAEGIAALENPPQVLIDFLDYYENMPNWTYMKVLQENMASNEGQAFLHAKREAKKSNTIGNAFVEGARLTAGFFVGAYYPAVGQSLVSTGSINQGSARAIQTFKFFDDISDVRDFLPHGKAVRGGAKVRLGHAFARRQIDKKGTWDKDYYGEIISDFDNMIFASGIILGINATQSPDFNKYGVDPGKAITYLLGAPKELLMLDQNQVYRFFLMAVSHLDGSPETARQVYQAFKKNEHYKPLHTIEDWFYKEVAYLFSNLLTRILWGNEIANNITMEKYFYGIPLQPLANLISKQVNDKPAKAAEIIITATIKLMTPASKKSFSVFTLDRLGFGPFARKKRNKEEAYSGSLGMFDSEKDGE